MLLIADGNNLAWAGFHALRRPMKATTPERKTRAALVGLTQMFLGIIARDGEPPATTAHSSTAAATPITAATIVFDEGRPLRRRAIYPGYQLGREGDPNFIDNEVYILDAIRLFIEAAGAIPIDILRGTNTEADDLAAALALQSPGDVRIASTDRDFLQLVDSRISIYAPVKRTVITREDFELAVAPRTTKGEPVIFPAERYLDYRALSGDASDNLPGVPGLGTIGAARLLAFQPVDAFFGRPEQVTAALGRRNKSVEAAFADGTARTIVDRNRQLMDLRLAAKDYPDLAPYRRRGSWDPLAFERWFKGERIAGVESSAISAKLERMAARGG